MSIALITGASSGLGRRLVQLADQENLDEIWVIARREDRLAELQTICQTRLRLLALDLTSPIALNKIGAMLQAEKPTLAYLINAAGFGRIGRSQELCTSDLLAMLDLNCRAAIALTQIALPFLTSGSHILEICSVAAFQPIPSLNVYAASKALLYRYSRALHIELQPQGISVTAVCPYWIRDTEFIETAKKGAPANSFQRFPFAVNTDFVAQKAWQAAKNNQAVVTPGFLATLHRLFAKILPSSCMMRISELFRQI